MANKPTFTLLDYKQRIIDELARSKSSTSCITCRHPQENVDGRPGG